MARLGVVYAREALDAAQTLRAEYADEARLATEQTRLQVQIAVSQALSLARRAVLTSGIMLGTLAGLWLAAQLLLELPLRQVFIPVAVVIIVSSAVEIRYGSQVAPEPPPPPADAFNQAAQSHRIAVASLVVATVGVVIAVLQLVVAILD